MTTAEPIWPPAKRIHMPADHWDWSIPTPLSQGWQCGPFIYVGGRDLGR